jgi:hypothetical protein
MKKAFSLLLLVLFAVVAINCTATEKGAGMGAVAGGVIGGVIGHQSGHGAEGAAIGAALGGVTGAAVGHEQDKRAAQGEQIIQICPGCGVGVDVTGYAPGTLVRCPKCNTTFPVE